MTHESDSSSGPESSARKESRASAGSSPGSGTSNQPLRPAKTRRAYWKTLIGLLVVAAIVQAAIWIGADRDSSVQMFSAFMIWPSVGLLVLLWWTFLSGLGWRTRLAGWGVVAVALSTLFGLFRIEGFSGDFIPQFALRMQPSPEQQAVAYFESQTPSAAPEIERIEISPGDWPQFRGPTRDGIVRHVGIRRDWDAHPPKKLWKHVVGLGWSSFAVVDGLAFTQEQRGEQEAVVCYALETGDQIWAHTDRTRFSETMGGDGPRATPTVYESRVYSLGATGILNCFDPISGELHWSRNILRDAGLSPETGNLPWGMAGSPCAYDDVVVVNPGGPDGKSVIAYDIESGEIRFSGGDRRAAYVAPRLAAIDGVRQILVYGAEGIGGHDSTTAEELWWHAWANPQGINAAQPIVVDETGVFVSTGYNVGCLLLDVTQTEQGWKAEPRWKRENKFKLKFNGGVHKDGYIYGLDEGILACLDVAAGEHTWKRGRYKYGQLLLIDDVLLVTDEWGKVALVEANPDRYREIASFQAVEGKTWNHPALANGRLLIRSDREAACFDVSPVVTTASGGDGNTAARNAQ